MTLLGAATDIVEFQYFPTFYRKLINFKGMHGGVYPQDNACPRDVKNVKWYACSRGFTSAGHNTTVPIRSSTAHLRDVDFKSR